MIQNLYWRIQSALETRYFKFRYARHSPGIYYDRLYKCYINPVQREERGSLYYVLCETVNDGLIYHYRLGSQCEHEHTFDMVMLQAYEKSASFSIPEEYRYEYSTQEIALLQKLVEKGNVHQGPQ